MSEPRYRHFRAQANREGNRDITLQLSPDTSKLLLNGIDTSREVPFMNYMPVSPTNQNDGLSEEDMLEILAMTQQTVIPRVEEHPLPDESNLAFLNQDISARYELRNAGLHIVPEIDFCQAEAIDNYEETFQEP